MKRLLTGTVVCFTLLLFGFSQGIDFTHTLTFNVYNNDMVEKENGAGIWIPDLEQEIRGLEIGIACRYLRPDGFGGHQHGPERQLPPGE